MNLSDLQAEYQDQLNIGDSSQPLIVNRMNRNLNLAYRELLAKKGLSRLRRKVLTFASVANTPYATLPLIASRIIHVQDRTNTQPLDEMSLADVRYNDPGNVATGAVPYGYVVLNLSAPVNRDPTTPAELFVKSTSATDGSGLQAYISGVVTGGYLRRAKIPMNGLTAVSIAGSITTWSDITRFSLSAPARGDVTLTMTSGAGIELAFIPSGRAISRYSRIILYPTPTAAVTYHADVELSVEDLLNPYDEPIFNEDFHWLITSGAYMREYLRKGKGPEYAAEKTRYKEGISELIAFTRRASGIERRVDTPRRFSQLGSNFPANS